MDFCFAIGPPTLTSPANNSTVTSTTLNWSSSETNLATSNPFRIQVDDAQSFPSATIEKDYYTANTHYTPVLSSGTWFWRVKVKDINNTWSDWSEVWQFTLGSSLTPSPNSGQATTQPEPTSTPVPTPPPTATPIPTDIPTPTKASLSFNATDIPEQSDGASAFTVSVSLNNAKPNSTYYLKGAFIKTGSSNYFGLTKNNGNWIKNSQNYSQQPAIITDNQGNWTGSLELMPDTSDAGFTGEDNYNLKVARYEPDGDGPYWSNISMIKITQNLSNSSANDQSDQNKTPQTSTSQPPSLTASPQILSEQVQTHKNNLQKNFQTPPKIAESLKFKFASGSSVAGVATKSDTTNQTPPKPGLFNPPLGIGILLIILGSGSLVYALKKP